MDEAKFRIGVDGKEELAQFFQRSEAGAKRFSGTVSTEMRKVGGEISAMASTAGRSLAALGGLGTGLGIVQTARSVLELRDQVQGVAAVAGLAEDKIAGLRQEIIAAGIATNNFGSDMGEALNEFVAKTGDIDKGRQSLELFGKVATATRSSAKDIAAIGADLQKLGITDQGKAFSILAKQSDVGAVELKDLVSQGPRLLAAFQGAGLSGEAGLRHGGALAQVFQQGTGNVERTSTAVEATFRDIAMRRDLLQNSGIAVDGRDRTDVLKDIITKSKGNEFVLRRIFGDEAFRGVQVMASEYRKTGGFGSFDRFSNVAADGSTIDQKYALNTNSTLARAKAAQIQMQASGDRNFGDFLDQASGVLPSVSGAFDFATAHPLLALGGGLAARSGLRMLGGALRGGRGGGAAGGALSGALGSAGLGIPVMVTNWPEGIGGSAGGLGKAIGEAVAEKAQLGLVARGLAAVGGGGGVAAIAGGVAATVAASVAVTSRLNAAMPQIRRETEDFIRSHQEDRAHAQLQEESGRDAGNLLLGTFGRFGGAFTAAQARAARQGAGSYGRSAADVLAGFGQQQDLLGVLARGEAGGVGEDLMRTDPQFALVLDSLNASNPAFKNAKTGKDKAKVLQALIAQNNAESFRAPRVDHTDDVSTPGGPSLPFGLDKLLGSATGDASRFASIMREALGLTFNITIGTDGDITVDAPKGTRAPKVMANRGA